MHPETLSGCSIIHSYKVINFITSIMYSSEISGVIVSSEEFGCAYTVCTEGELLYAPLHEGGGIETMEFDFVDFDTMDEETAEKVERIHSALIDMMTRAGLYFRQPVGHS